MHIKEYIVLCIKKYQEIYNDYIPENFSWYSKFPSELNDEKFDKIRKKITHAKNQQSLGVCWAIAFASTVNDAYLISEILDWNPNISTTYIMSKFAKIGDCTKGSIISLGRLVENHQDGFVSENCIDYSWCENNKRCKQIVSEMKTNEKAKEEFKNMIPTPGCYYGGKYRYFYTISKVCGIAWYDFIMPPRKRLKYIEKFIKIHIVIKSPVIYTFPLFESFKNFGKNPNNKNKIYFENNYNTNGISTLEIANGLHSVCIMGWGIERNVKLYSGKTVDVPYWVIRNSWGQKWGNNGFCKIAGYPFNIKCSPENIYKNNKEETLSPHLIFLEVNKFPEMKKLPAAVFSGEKFNLIKSKKYYSTDEQLLTI